LADRGRLGDSSGLGRFPDGDVGDAGRDCERPREATDRVRNFDETIRAEAAKGILERPGDRLDRGGVVAGVPQVDVDVGLAPALQGQVSSVRELDEVVREQKPNQFFLFGWVQPRRLRRLSHGVSPFPAPTVRSGREIIVRGLLSGLSISWVVSS